MEVVVESKFGLARIKKEGDFISHDGLRSEAPIGPPSTWVERRVPEHLADEANYLIDALLERNFYYDY
jgi:hypothetical protein